MEVLKKLTQTASAPAQGVKRPHDDTFADMSQLSAPFPESERPTAGLRNIVKALLKYITVLDSGRYVDGEKMVHLVKSMSAIEPTAHPYLDAYKVHAGGSDFRMMTAQIEDEPHYMDELGDGSPVMKTLVAAAPVAALNAMLGVLLGYRPVSLTQVYGIESNSKMVHYTAKGETEFPVRLRNTDPTNWGSGITAIVQSGRYSDWLILGMQTPSAAATCTRLFGRPKSDAVTQIGHNGGTVVQRYMDRADENAVALLLPPNSAFPTETHTLLLGASASLNNTDLSITLPSMTGADDDFGALQPYYIQANRRDTLMALAFTIWTLYDWQETFADFRANVNNTDLGVSAAMLISIGNQLALLGYDNTTPGHAALATAAGHPFSDVGIRAAADTGVCTFSNVVLFGAATLTLSPLVLAPPGSIVLGMANVRTHTNQVDSRDIKRTPLAAVDVAAAISRDVRIWHDAVPTEFRTVRLADRDFFCLPVDWLSTPAPGRMLRDLISVQPAGHAFDNVDALAKTLLDSNVMGAPCPNAFGQQMRVLMESRSARLLKAVETIAE